MPAIAGLVLHHETQARLREGLRGRAELLVVATCRDLLALAAERRLAAAIVELRDREGVLTAPIVRRLREGLPLLPVIACCTPAQMQMGGADLFALVQAGVCGVIVRGVDDAGALLHAALDAAEDECHARRAWRAIEGEVDAPARVIVECCLTSARRAPTVAEVARALGMHRKTLGDRLARAGLPPPRTIVGWSRLLLAARLMEDRARPLERIALELRFPGAASLRNMLRRYTGLRPGEVRAGGGFALVLESFRRALRDARCDAARLSSGPPTM